MDYAAELTIRIRVPFEGDDYPDPPEPRPEGLTPEEKLQRAKVEEAHAAKVSKLRVKAAKHAAKVLAEEAEEAAQKIGEVLSVQVDQVQEAGK